jgi:hypothetical protein
MQDISTLNAASLVNMREFDLVLFWSLDQLSREGGLQTLTSYGVAWKSYTEQ